MAGGDDGLLGARHHRVGGLTAPERDYSHRSRLDKLGVKPGSRVRLLGIDDADFVRELLERGAEIVEKPPFDLAFLFAEQPRQLERLSMLRRSLDPAGAIWVLRAKGNSRAVGELDIIDAGKRHALVDNKVASFSDALSAMRLVIPLADRRRDGG